LYVYDYLERHNFEDQKYLAKYSKAHDDLFKSIEQRIQSNSSIRYVRLLALPLYPEENSLYSESSIKKAIIKYCSLPLFEHILRCIEKHLEYESEKTKSGFYMVSYPTKTFHYALVDSGKFFISEYFRYNKEKQCKPDILYVQENNGSYQHTVEIYNREMTKLMKKTKKFTTPGISVLISELISQERQNLENPIHSDEKRDDLKNRIAVLERKLGVAEGFQKSK
jgi:hypothetical protein